MTNSQELANLICESFKGRCCWRDALAPSCVMRFPSSAPRALLPTLSWVSVAPVLSWGVHLDPSLADSVGGCAGRGWSSRTLRLGLCVLELWVPCLGWPGVPSIGLLLWALQTLLPFSVFHDEEMVRQHWFKWLLSSFLLLMVSESWILSMFLCGQRREIPWNTMIQLHIVMAEEIKYVTH